MESAVVEGVGGVPHPGMSGSGGLKTLVSSRSYTTQMVDHYILTTLLICSYYGTCTSVRFGTNLVHRKPEDTPFGVFPTEGVFGFPPWSSV